MQWQQFALQYLWYRQSDSCYQKLPSQKCLPVCRSKIFRKLLLVDQVHCQRKVKMSLACQLCHKGRSSTMSSQFIFSCMYIGGTAQLLQCCAILYKHVLQCTLSGWRLLSVQLNLQPVMQQCVGPVFDYRISTLVQTLCCRHFKRYELAFPLLRPYRGRAYNLCCSDCPQLHGASTACAQSCVDQFCTVSQAAKVEHFCASERFISCVQLKGNNIFGQGISCVVCKLISTGELALSRPRLRKKRLCRLYQCARQDPPALTLKLQVTRQGLVHQ